MKEVFNNVAKEYGTTAEEVEKEISQALMIAMRSESTEAQRFWKKLSCEESISIERVVNAIVSELQKQT